MFSKSENQHCFFCFKIGVVILIIIAILLLAGFLFWLVYYSNRCENHLYINHEAVCKKEIIRKTNYAEFRGQLMDFIEAEKKNGQLVTLGLYFRDLSSGPIFGINELEDFAPASLLKLPLVIAYLNLEEQNPGFIQRSIKYLGPVSPVKQTIASPVDLKVGDSYKIEDLLFYIAAYSDNEAYETLLQYLEVLPGDKILLLETYQELGVIEPDTLLSQTINVRGYASIFRIIYNVSYLNPSLAEKLLFWLTQDNFNNGLIAGVPQGVKVAHKFGEREVSDGKTIFAIKQLHDCGIVYYPKNPYLLCIMTRGYDLTYLSDIIKTISQKVYEEVDSRKY